MTNRDPIRARQWRAEWRKRNPYYHRYRDIRVKYGLTPEQYDAMVLAQDSKCAICGDVMIQVNVDHDHETSKVRELLCQLCNQGLGCFKDRPDVLELAIEYLCKHREIHELSCLL
jgi:hypothetical protein